MGCNKLLEKAGESILSSLRRLNELPRTDPFWENTNRRPTVYKLHDFCNRLLRDNPQDVLALWTIASLNLLWGVDELSQDQWKRLHDIGNFDVSWVVHAGLFSYLNAGIEADDLAKLLIDMNGVEESKPLLHAFSKSEADLVADWGKKVLSRLGFGTQNI
jgi:hypothetical protein